MLEAAFEVLRAEGDDACLALVRAHGGGGRIELIDGPLAAEEAVAFAHGLADLGREIEALEVLSLVMDAGLLGELLGPQGDQVARAWAQGHCRE